MTKNDKFPLPERVPYHVAMIMDGNGRWAKRRHMPRIVGHRAGTENLRAILRACVEFGIKILTVYAFSTENWGRPEQEVNGLMNILETVIGRELKELHANGVQLRHIGELDRVPPRLQVKVRDAIRLTKDNDRLILNIALNYGGRDEIVRAVRQMIADDLSPEEIDEDILDYYMDTAGQPDPDLIIRTGGDLRVSNFLVWQGAYSEYYTTHTYWPDFGKEKLYEAILEFGQRERRFGLVPQA